MSRPDALIPRLLPALRGQQRLDDTLIIAGLEALSLPSLSRTGGLVAQARLPRPVLLPLLRAYVRYFGVDLSEAERPLEAYRSFDEFFTRRLARGVHVVDRTPGIGVCPVDGRVLTCGRVADGRIEQVKGRSYTVADLLDSPDDARRFSEGGYATLYLSPRDYHRIHCPADGEVVRYRYVPGRLYPVNRFGVRLVDRVLAVNERLISYVVSRELGELAVVKVGATNVGMISCTYAPIRTNRGSRAPHEAWLRPPFSVERGGELGAFHLGSTVVVLFARADVGIVPLEAGQVVRMGQPLLRVMG